MRRMNVPSVWRANSQLKSAERAPPTCNDPVGDGAKRTRGPTGSRLEAPLPSVVPGERTTEAPGLFLEDPVHHLGIGQQELSKLTAAQREVVDAGTGDDVGRRQV